MDASPDRQTRGAAEMESLTSQIASKATELGRLLIALDGQARDASQPGATGFLKALGPDVRGALERAFGTGVRDAILADMLDACGDTPKGHTPDGRSDESAAREVRITDAELVALVSRLFRQLAAIDAAVADLARDLMLDVSRGGLPGYVANLTGYTLQLIRRGGSESVDVIHSYLGDINRWMVQILQAWAHAPEEWWQTWWEKLHPRAIEEQAPGGFLRNRGEECWRIYKKLCMDLLPSEVKTQMLEVAGNLVRGKGPDRDGT